MACNLKPNVGYGATACTENYSGVGGEAFLFMKADLDGVPVYSDDENTFQEGTFKFKQGKGVYNIKSAKQNGYVFITLPSGYEAMTEGKDVVACIGPSISLESFEVGDEVYEIFRKEGFPMQCIAKRFPADGGEAWHIDLWEANRWLMEQQGVTDIFVQGICTRSSMDFYSARRETINTGRNYNGIMILR